MPDALASLPCPLCSSPAFDGRPAVQCGACGLFLHRECFTTLGRCPKKTCGAKKPVTVAVVRLEPPGPDLASIAEAARKSFESVLHPMIADMRSEMAHREDVERLRPSLGAIEGAMSRHAEETQALIESVRAGLDRRIADVAAALAEAERRLRAAPQLAPADIAAAVRPVAEQASQSFELRVTRLREELSQSLSALERAVRVEAQRNLLAIEACRWDTAARGSPLPWDARSDQVLDPAPSGAAEGEDAR